MNNKISSVLILLTYKSKALLMYKSESAIDEVKHAWSFIGCNNNLEESFESILEKSVKKEIGIKLDKIEFISKHCYHASLTDDNVNQIKRSEGQLLDFFNLTELKKLLLTYPTQEFVSKHSNLISSYS